MIEQAGCGVAGDVDIGVAIVVEVRCDGGEAVAGVLIPIPLAVETSVKPLPLLWKRKLRPFGRPRGPHMTGRPFHLQFSLPPGAAFWQDRNHVAGDDEIELAIQIVVDERASCVPACLRRRESGGFGDVTERAIAFVVVENAVAVVGNEKVAAAIVIVIGGAAPCPQPVCAKPAFASRLRNADRRDCGTGGWWRRRGMSDVGCRMSDVSGASPLPGTLPSSWFRSPEHVHQAVIVVVEDHYTIPVLR